MCLWVHDGRVGPIEGDLWWHGQELGSENLVAATATHAGMARGGPLHEVVARYHPSPEREDELRVLAALEDSLMPDGEVMEVLAGVGDTDPVDLPSLGRALARIDLRDEAWLWVESLPHSDRQRFADLAYRLALGVARELRAPLLFLHAWAQWRVGAGMSARIAADTVLEIDPDYSASVLLLGALEAGLNPFTTPNILDPDEPESARATASQSDRLPDEGDDIAVR